MAVAPTSDSPNALRPGGSPLGRRVVRYGLLALTAAALIDVVVGEKGLLALRRARHELGGIEQSVQAARVENQRLLDLARRYREDPTAVEELARRDLGLIRPGEVLFILRDAPPPPAR
jgi:cell division protein FtsB